MLPCEYCGEGVIGAEAFMELGVSPCCDRCKWIPLSICVVAALGSLGFGLWWVLS